MSTAAALERALDDLVGHARTPGLRYVVVNASSTLFERYAGVADITGQRPMRAGITMMAYSMSKTVTAAAVLQLVESNRVRLDDPVARYVSAQPYGSEFTVRQLLSHTSGTPNPIPLRWVHPSSAHETFDERAELARVLRRHGRLAFTPGTRFVLLEHRILAARRRRGAGERTAVHLVRHRLRPWSARRRPGPARLRDPRSRHACGGLPGEILPVQPDQALAHRSRADRRLRGPVAAHPRSLSEWTRVWRPRRHGRRLRRVPAGPACCAFVSVRRSDPRALRRATANRERNDSDDPRVAHGLEAAGPLTCSRKAAAVVSTA